MGAWLGIHCSFDWLKLWVLCPNDITLTTAFVTIIDNIVTT
jgi:hypothetical protein